MAAGAAGAGAGPVALPAPACPHPSSHRARGKGCAPGRARGHTAQLTALEHLQAHFPHCFKPQISTSVYLNWLVMAELICLKAEPETLGSWTGKSQTNKQNLLKL